MNEQELSSGQYDGIYLDILDYIFFSPEVVYNISYLNRHKFSIHLLNHSLYN